MNHRPLLKILSLAIILTMTLSFAACEQVPSEPVTESDGVQASNAKTDGIKDPSSGNDTDLQTGLTSVGASETGTDSDAKNDNSDETDRTDSNRTENEKPSDLPSDKNSKPSSERPATNTATEESREPASSTSTKPSASTTATSSKPTSSSSKPTESDTVNSETEPEDTPVQPTVNTDITPISPKDYYGRTWLATQSNGANLVKIYEELVAGIGARKDTFNLSVGITAEELSTVWDCYRSDYPQHFWLGLGYSYSYSNGIVLSVTPQYIMTDAQKATAQTQFDAAVNNLLSGINKSMTQYDIEKTIHNRLIIACEYNNGTNAHNAYGALVEGVAVCEGFARAFQYLCRAVGIQTLFVQGTSENPTTGALENHAWNVIRIDGQYYHIDVTWDNAGEPTEGSIHYAWFNLTTARISEDHTLKQEGYPAPACTATAANYFKKTGGEFSTLTVNDVLNRTTKKGDAFFFQAYITDQSDVAGWFEQNARTLANHYGLNGYTYSLMTVGKEICFIMKTYRG